MKKILELISTASHSRTTALLVILVIGAAIPLTVLVAQKQQEIRQQAAGNIDLKACIYRGSGSAQCDFNPLTLLPGEEAIQLFWEVNNNSICIASGNWSGPKPYTNNQGMELMQVHSDSTFNLTCGSDTDSVTVIVPGGGTQPPPGSESCSTTGQLRCSGDQIQICADAGSGRFWGPPTDCQLGTVCTGNGQCTDASTPPVVPPPGGGSCQLKTCGEQVGATCTCNADGSDGSCDAAISAIIESGDNCIFKLNTLYSCSGIANAAQMAITACGGTTTPSCDAGIVCGTCEAPLANTCSANNGAKGCEFTTLSGGGSCNRVPAPDEPCTIDKCVSPNVCGNGICNLPGTSCTMEMKVCPDGSYVGRTGPKCEFAPCPTPTVENWGIDFTLKLNGIGASGDSKNPTVTTNLLTHPVSSQQKKTFSFTFADASKKELASTTSTGTYDQSGSVYKSGTPVNFTIPPTTVYVLISTPGYLRSVTNISSILNSNSDEQVTLASLIAGELNGDKQVSVLDHNILTSCMNGFISYNTSTCGNNAQAADFNGDGKVDQLDYNLLLREFGQTGN